MLGLNLNNVGMWNRVVISHCQRMLNSPLRYALELEHVLVLLPCRQLTQWTWYEVGSLSKYCLEISSVYSIYAVLSQFSWTLAMLNACCPNLGIDDFTLYPFINFCRQRCLLTNIEESSMLFQQFFMKKALALYTEDGFLL